METKHRSTLFTTVSTGTDAKLIHVLQQQSDREEKLGLGAFILKAVELIEERSSRPRGTAAFSQQEKSTQFTEAAFVTSST